MCDYLCMPLYQLFYVSKEAQGYIFSIHIKDAK